jgi:hypothetical protein
MFPVVVVGYHHSDLAPSAENNSTENNGADKNCTYKKKGPMVGM